MRTTDYDVAVVGAGFGGLACALSLAERGARVALFERLTYPGGCASTFSRRGWQFEAGATLFSGFGQGQLFGRWIDRFDLPVTFEAIDPVVEMRSDAFTLPIPRDRRTLVRRFAELKGVSKEAACKVESFFAHQKRIADGLWALFDDPSLLPPFSVKALGRHLMRSPEYLPLIPLLGRSLGDLLEQRGLQHVQPVRTYLDAVCQITVQTDAARAEAPFALAATDYFFRGTGHIRGGIGQLARSLSDAIEGLEGDVFFADAVQQLRPWEGAWTVTSRRREVRARTVVANLLPRALADLLDCDLEACPELGELSESVQKGWGAAMLYLGLEPEADVPEAAHHFELIDDSSRPFIEGNHVFCSVSSADEAAERTPNGGRTVTCSTHIPMAEMPDGEAARADYVAAVQETMRQTIRRRAPEIAEAVVLEMPASPRTFQRFTGRPEGYVGGIPREAGLHNYQDIVPRPIRDGLYLVGDSVFPGQSTLACALGGVKVADVLERSNHFR